MIQFNTDSWHFRFVVYVFGDSFFTEKDSIDIDASTKTRNIVWITKPKVINFCPYCRAVIAAITLIPIAWILKKIPRKQKKFKPFDIKKSRRNTKIIRIAAMIAIGLFGVHQLYEGNYGVAIFHFLLASFQIWGIFVFRWYSAWYAKRMEKKNKDVKQNMLREKNNSSLLMTYLHTNHSKICPLVAFVDKNDTETRV